MIVVTTHLGSFDSRKQMSVTKILVASADAQMVYIRSQFDCACTDATAAAAIEVAEMLGYSKLASEMKIELETQLGRIRS